jgi:hypothetical protein
MDNWNDNSTRVDGEPGDPGRAEAPIETAHKRGLITGLVVGAIGGAILGGIVVGLVDTRQAQPVATGPAGGRAAESRPAERSDRVWGTTDSEFGPGRVDRDVYQEYRTPETQRRLEGPGATPGTQPAPR